jgi:two-component SAPR family response regulator
MRAICVDDERRQLEDTVCLVGGLPRIDEVKGFTGAADALEWLSGNAADLALLDIEMPGMNGMELAAHIKTRWPNMAIIFLTRHPQYALEAFELRADGYILKPAERARLESEIDYAFAEKRSPARGHIVMKTFGSFDCFVDGETMLFRQAKCKELLAYLVDRRGSSVTRAEAFAILWEDRLYDRSMQKQLDVIIRSLRATLQEYGIASILEMKGGTMRIQPEQLQCDLYRFLSGEADAVSAYRGEYMSGYAWAELTEGYLTRRIESRETGR